MKFGNISTSVDIENFNNADTVSATFFYYGCNFRCGFCHNYNTLGKKKETLTETQVKLALNKAKSNWVRTIVVSGGEPTLDEGLPEFLSFIKERGFRTYLHTNGSQPEVIDNLVEEKLVDFIAMDIKGTPSQYEEITNFRNIDVLQKSIDIIKNKCNYEFRTTVIPKYHSKKEIEEIGEWLSGSRLYVLQQFRPDLENGCLDKKMEEEVTYTRRELETLSEVAWPFFQEVKVRSKYEG